MMLLDGGSENKRSSFASLRSRPKTSLCAYACVCVCVCVCQVEVTSCGHFDLRVKAQVRRRHSLLHLFDL